MKVPTTEEILEAARLATESFFVGEIKTKRSIRQDMTSLMAMLRDYDAKQITTRLEKPK